MVGATATAHHVQVRQSPLEVSVLQREFSRIANIELRGLIQFGMALARGIGAKTPNSFDEGFPLSQHVLKVSGMGAVDHVVAGITRRRLVHLLDRLLERLTRGQIAIGLHGEGNRHGHARPLRRARNPNSLLHVVHGDRAHHIRRGTSEHFDLVAMVVLRFLLRHHAVGNVAVATGAQTSADDHWHLLGFVFVPNLFQQMDRLPVCISQGLGRIAKPPSPIGTGSPRRAFENQPCRKAPGDLGVGSEVLEKGRFALWCPEQVERDEVRKF